MQRRWSVSVVLGVLALALSGCDFPADSQGTIDGIRRSRQLEVGVTEDPPWVVRNGEAWSGVEVRLVEKLAAQLGVEITWVTGTQSELLEGLEHRAVDLVAAGLVSRDPWAAKVTFTPPFLTTHTAVGVRPEELPIDDLHGVTVAVERGSVAEAKLRESGADVELVEDVAKASGAVAAEVWELRRLGLSPTQHRLVTEDHVLAVPKGENAWLVYVENFVDAHRDLAARLLEEEGAS